MQPGLESRGLNTVREKHLKIPRMIANIIN